MTADAARPVDVALFLESASALEPGGDASWILELLSELPDLSFGVLCLGGDRDPERAPCASSRRSDGVPLEKELGAPPNVRYVEEVAPGGPRTSGRGGAAALTALRRFIEGAMDGHITGFEEICRAAGSLSREELTLSPGPWRLLEEVYGARARETSFPDFVRLWCAALHPLFRLLCTPVPPAGVYHATSAGPAGLLSVLARTRRKRPLVLSGYGIYADDRRARISRAEWLSLEGRDDLVARRDIALLKDMDLRICDSLARLVHEYCDEAVALTPRIAGRAVAAGAPADRVRTVPRGVNIASCAGKRPARGEGAPMTVGLAGPVVPAADVKTFVRACSVVAERVPHVEFLVTGSLDEDRQYVEECVELASLLGVGGKLKLLGEVDAREYYPRLDALAVTGLAEGLPVAILEAFCSGVPCVATRVGESPGLLEGVDGEDAALGPAGFLTDVASPRETAYRLVELLTDSAQHRRFSEAARARVRKRYSHDAMVAAWHEIYTSALAAPDAEPRPVAAGCAAAGGAR